jgi:hypothetical protein
MRKYVRKTGKLGLSMSDGGRPAIAKHEHVKSSFGRINTVIVIDGHNAKRRRWAEQVRKNSGAKA